MDKEFHMEEAKKFQRTDSCYIHTEMEDGKCPKTVMCGDVMGLLWGIVAELGRVSEITHLSFKDTVAWMLTVHKFGYPELRERFDRPDYKVYEGKDYEEEMIKQIRLEEEKRANIENANLKIDLKNAEKKIRQLENQLRLVKENAEKESNALKADKLKLSKECNELEARMKEMEKKWINDCK